MREGMLSQTKGRRMKYRNAIISLTLMGAVVLPGCNLIKKVARGDEISRGDLVNEADKQNCKREGKKEDIERYEKAIAEDLKVIEEFEYLSSVADGRQHTPGFAEAIDYISVQDAMLRS